MAGAFPPFQVASATQVATLPCSELQPYEIEERPLWAFRCGLKRSLQQSPDRALATFAQRIDEWEVSDVAIFGLAFYTGVQAGCSEALVRYFRDLAQMMRDIATAVFGFVETASSALAATYDPEAWKLMIDFYRAAPGSSAQAEALEAIADYLADEYPDLTDALHVLGMVSAALMALKEWIETNPHAMARILIAVSSAVGQLIGAELGTLSGLASSPARLGRELGGLVGNACMELGLLILGF